MVSAKRRNPPLRDAIFLATCVATLEKRNRLQVAEDMLYVAIENLMAFSNVTNPSKFQIIE